MRMLRGVAVIAALTGLMVGCASLRIDVDVYKGPLSNDEEVQLEQMAAMAIGAKPLLFRLRDDLERSWTAKEGGPPANIMSATAGDDKFGSSQEFVHKFRFGQVAQAMV